MGREQFDYAFREYARRWAFKHPEPADFFRTMEDAILKQLFDGSVLCSASCKWGRANPAKIKTDSIAT